MQELIDEESMIKTATVGSASPQKVASQRDENSQTDLLLESSRDTVETGVERGIKFLSEPNSVKRPQMNYSNVLGPAHIADGPTSNLTTILSRDSAPKQGDYMDQLSAQKAIIHGKIAKIREVQEFKFAKLAAKAKTPRQP